MSSLYGGGRSNRKGNGDNNKNIVWRKVDGRNRGKAEKRRKKGDGGMINDVKNVCVRRTIRWLVSGCVT